MCSYETNECHDGIFSQMLPESSDTIVSARYFITLEPEQSKII